MLRTQKKESVICKIDKGPFIYNIMDLIKRTNDNFVAEIKQILEGARERAYSAINEEMVKAYWLVGRRIVEEEQQGKERANYGENLLKNLSVELTRDFGKGYSSRNLRNFRQFYITFPETENRHTLYANTEQRVNVNDLKESIQPVTPIWQTLSAKLSWSHICLIMRVKNADAREYYIKEAA